MVPELLFISSVDLAKSKGSLGGCTEMIVLF